MLRYFLAFMFGVPVVAAFLLWLLV